MKRFIIGIILVIAAFSFIIEKNYAVEEPIMVTASVNPQPSDMTISIAADVPEDSYLVRDQEVQFTITFDVLPNTGFPLTIVASWEEGLIVGSSANYVEAFDYVLGSASTAYDATVPVVDLLNRTITWDLPNASHSSIPHQVTFSLRVKPSFLTTDIIEVYTNVDATYQTAIIPQDRYRLYIDPVAAGASPTPTITPTDAPTDTPTPTLTPTPTETPTPLPTDTPTPTPTPESKLKPTITNTPTPTPTPIPLTSTPGPTSTPTPTPIPTPTEAPSFQKFVFRTVDIQNITDTSVLVTTTTSIDSTVKVLYGLCSSQTLSEELILDGSNTYHEIRLDGLTPQSSYCFQIQATNTLLQKSIYSDVFIVRTAKQGDAYVINSSRTMWNSLQLNSSLSKNLLIPQGLPAVLSLEISHPELISQLDGEFVNRSVLGASTLGRQNIQQVRFIEVGSGIFSAEIETPKLAGNYYFTLRIKDTNGRYSKVVFPYTYTTSPFLHVIDQDSNPVENAYVSIERFEESRRAYAPFNAAFTLNQAQKSFFLPYATDANGQLRIALPIGKYRLSTHAIGYANSVTEFQIMENTPSYPEIVLNGSFSLSSYVEYIQMTIQTAYERFQYDADQYFSTRILLTVSMVFQLIMLLGIGVFFLGKVGVIDRVHTQFAVFLRDFEEELFELFMGAWAIANIIFSIAFVLFQGVLSSLPIILITVVVVISNILIFVWKEKTIHPKRNIS